jgi:hypothetical protein
MAYIYYRKQGMSGLGVIATTSPSELTEILAARAHAVRSAPTDTDFFTAQNRLFEVIAAALNVEAGGRTGLATLEQWEAFTDSLRHARYTAENEVPPSMRPAPTDEGGGSSLTRWLLPAAGVTALVGALVFLGTRAGR